MDTNVKIERMTVDGRRVEVHSFEQLVNGETHRITEQFEEIIPLTKRRTVTERVVPVVVERITEQYDGNQVNKVVEKVASEDQQPRTTPVPVSNNAPITAADVESIVRKVVGENQNRSFFGWFGKKTPTVSAVPTPVVVTPAVSGGFFNSPIVTYTFVTLLAVEVGFMVWALFIR